MNIPLEAGGCISLVVSIICFTILPFVNDAETRARQLYRVNVKAKRECVLEGYNLGYYDPSTGKRVCEIYKSF